MARGSFDPEIKKAVGDSKLGRLNTSPPKPSPSQLTRGGNGGAGASAPMPTVENATLPQKPRPPTPPTGSMPPDAHHVAAAAGIAHAILAHKGMM